jgi:hypothetical protein
MRFFYFFHSLFFVVRLHLPAAFKPYSRLPSAAEASPPVAEGNFSLPPKAASAGRRSRPQLAIIHSFLTGTSSL